MTLRLSFAALLALFVTGISVSQTLPDVDVPVTSRNYYEICRQLDDYFATDPASDTDCPDNERLKYERWKWWWRDRVNADGSFPELRDQWLESRKLAAISASDRNNSPVWQHEGPKNNPNYGYWGMGRTKNVAFHPTNPDVMWVGTPDGGIWKTTDGGENWAAFGDELPYLPVSVILVDHQNPDNLYISLGDKGGWWMWNLGVYKSTDGGETWAPTALDWQLSQNNVIYNMIMSPADPKVIFAATNRGIMRTTDGGESWQNLRAGEYTDIEFKTGDPATIYAAHHNYWGTSQVVKSADGGTTWVQITQFADSQNEIRLATSPLQPEWLAVHFSSGHRLLLSKDGGQTYAENVAPEDDWGIFCFSPTDTNTIYLCGVVVHRSQDQGATWAPITHWYNDGVHAEVHADAHDLVHDPHVPGVIWYCNDGGIYRYEEFGETWTDYSNGLAITQFYRIDVSQIGELKLMAGSQDNGGWLRTQFSGWRHTNGGDAMCQIVDPVNPAYLYTEYYGGNDIYRSNNNFISSVNIADNIPENPSGDWVTPFLLNPRNSKTFIVGLHDVYRSFNRGDSFHKISENLTGSVDNKIRDVAMSPADTNLIAVAARANRVYRTWDGGATWTNNSVSTNTEDITRIALHPSNPQRMWVTKGGYASGKKVFASVNGGVNWQNKSGNLPNVPFNCIIFDTLTNYLIAGSDIGVFYTDADNINWKPYGIGMPAVYVLDLKVRQNTRRLYAGTHGRGVYSVSLEQVVGTESPVGAVQDAAVVYPNPTGAQLFFRTGETNPFSGNIRMTDVTGRIALSKSVDGMRLDDLVLDVTGLPAGVYVLQAVDAGGVRRVVQRVVVNKQ